MSKIKPNIVRGGQSIDLGNNMFLMQGRPHSRGGIDIGKNLEVEGGEVMQYKPNEVRVFSKEPILNGVSPAQYVLGGANPNDVFNAQEYWKRVNRVSDDGKKYLTGGKIDKKSWTTVLNKRKEDEFLEWYKNISSILNLDSNPDNPLHAYDYRGYWLENRNKDIDYTKSDFHFPDKYKKPTHPTFSVESQYANKKYGINPKSVGYWNGDEFVPGVFNDIMNAPMLNTENVIKNKKRNLKTDKNWEDALLDFQTAFENFSSKAYVSPENDGTYTIGYGTKYIYDDNGKSRKVNENDKLTKEEALEQRRRYIKYSIEPNLKNWGLNNVDKYPDWLKFQLYDNVYNNRNFRNSKYLSLLKEYDNSEGYKKSDYNYDDIINESDFSVKHRRNDGKPSSLAIRGVMRQQPYNINFDDLNNVLIRDKQDSLYNVYNTLNYKLGGRIKKELGGNDFEPIKQREDFKPSKFKTILRKLYTSDESDTAVNRYGDFSRMYFGLPLKDGFLYKSNYKPTISKNKDAIYYGVRDINFIHDVIELYNHPGAFEKPKTGVVDGYSTKGAKQYPWQGDYISFDLGRELNKGNKVKLGRTPHTLGPGALGKFIVSRGKDEKGEYLSYYDLWDVNPKRSHKAEERGFAKPYEIYDRIYGTFDADGTFHPTGELQPAISKKLGGKINKPTNMDFNYIIGRNNIYKLGGRQKAPLGIDILNSQNLHRNAEVFDGVPAIAVSEQVVRPNLAEQQRLLDEASQIINNSIETNIDNSIRASINRGDSASNRIRRVRNINVPLTIDGRSATINKDGTIDLKNRYTLAGDNRGIGYKSISERNKLLRQAKVRNAVNNIKQSIKDNSSELLSTGINLAGNLAGSLINLNAINKMKYYDIIPLRANKLKTNININPQLDTLREQLARFEGDTRNNTSSSKVALARRQGARARTAQAINQLFGTKENLQTELINHDRLNQQQVGNMNVQMRNRWLAGKSQFDNQIRNMRAENAIAGINNAIAAFNGENGYFNTRDKKFNEQANRALYALTAPNAVDAITSKNAEKLINTFVEPRFRKRMRRSLGIED